MGKKKTTDMSTEQEVKEVKKTQAPKKAKKVKTVVVPGVKAAAAETTPVEAAPGETSAEAGAEAEKPTAPKKQRVRSKKYVTSRSMVDKTHLYPIEEAIALAKKTHYAKFAGTLETNLILRDGDISVEVTFPHATGRTVSVAIATDELLEEIQKGTISFTALVAHPSMMPKLAKLARILGPKGLMPNPKNGTLTPTPEKRKKELEGGATTVKSEKKFPLVHVTLGKLTQPDAELAANLRALLKAFPAGKVVKCSVSATMGPGIKVATE